MKIGIPAGARMVLDSLHSRGYEAYVVGGCVRDSILGRRPGDWDITTSALPDQVKEIFRKTVDTGIRHGTVTVLVGGGSYEVTTYRVDGEYRDGRHPESVSFTRSLEEDLKRRDFTINAMAYSEEAGLVDLWGGMEDLKKRQIRCVGDPLERFGEDALRILRAIRFSAQLSFFIEEETLKGIVMLADSLEKISAERISAEVLKLITSDHPDYLKVAWQAGVTRIFLPELDRMMETPQNNPHHRYTVGEHVLHSMCAVPSDRLLRLTMLLHDVGKPDRRTTDEAGIDHFKGHAPLGADMAVRILRRWKLDNDTISRVRTLILYHDWRVEPDERSVRRAVSKVGQELFPLLLKVQNADTLAQSEWRRPEKLQRISAVGRIFQEIRAKRQAVSLKELAVGGRDLMGIGIPGGPVMGEILGRLLEEVLDDPDRNDRELLMDRAARIWSERGEDSDKK